jgi:hypothetical protein
VAPVPLARALTNTHSHSNKHKVRRHSVHSVKPASTMMMPQIPSVFRLLPMHTTAIPHPEPPALGLGLELNPAAIDEYADGKSGPDFGNPSSAPVFVSNSNSSTLWGFGTGSTITLLSADATLRPRLTGMGGGFELYMPLEDEMMFQFSPQDLGASHDVDRSCDYRFTPVRSTIPLPLRPTTLSLETRPTLPPLPRTRTP